MAQALLILGPETTKALSEVARMVSVPQHLPPRLAVAEGTPEQLASLQGMANVTAILEPPVPESVLQQLNSTERLFAEAWTESRRPKKERPGDGLPWDAEGFEPPNGKPRG